MRWPGEIEPDFDMERSLSAVIAIGIVVKPSPRPSAACVVLSGSVDEPALLESFSLKSSEDSLENQLDLLGKALSSKLSGMRVDAVVIRVADFASVATRRAAASSRLLVEGALVFAARSRVTAVYIRNGKEVGERLGISKNTAEARGRQLDRQHGDAAAAALSGLVNVEQ